MVLTKREKYIAIGVAGLVLVLGLNWGVVAYGERRDEIKKQTDAAKAQLGQADYLFQRQQKMQKVWADMQKSGALKTDRTEAGNQLLNALRDWAQQSKVSEWTLKPERETQDGRFTQLTYHVTGNGPQRAMAEFLWRIETAPIPMRISEFTLTPKKEGEDAVQLQLSVSTLCLPPENEKDAAGGARSGASPSDARGVRP